MPKQTNSRSGKNHLCIADDRDWVPYQYKEKPHVAPRKPSTNRENAVWLRSTLEKNPWFSWDQFGLPGELVSSLRASANHTNCCTHFQVYFSATLKRLEKTEWSKSAMIEAWRYMPPDIKGAWRGIFKDNLQPTRASRRMRGQATNPQSDYEVTRRQMHMASTSNAGALTPSDETHTLRDRWSSSPTLFGSPRPEWDIKNADFDYSSNISYPPVVQSVAPYLNVNWASPMAPCASLCQTNWLSPPSGALPPHPFFGPSDSTATSRAFFGSPPPLDENHFGSRDLEIGLPIVTRPAQQERRYSSDIGQLCASPERGYHQPVIYKRNAPQAPMKYIIDTEAAEDIGSRQQVEPVEQVWHQPQLHSPSSPQDYSPSLYAASPNSQVTLDLEPIDYFSLYSATLWQASQSSNYNNAIPRSFSIHHVGEALEENNAYSHTSPNVLGEPPRNLPSIGTPVENQIASTIYNVQSHTLFDIGVDNPYLGELLNTMSNHGIDL